MLMFLQVQSTIQCNKSFPIDDFNQASVNVNARNLLQPNGFNNSERNDLACVSLDKDASDMVG